MTQILTHNEWLEARKLHIGASEVAAILGISPFKGPLDVYLSKTEDQTENEAYKRHLAFGHDVEEAIAKAYKHDTGREYEDRGATTFHVHPAIPYLAATLDRVTWEVDDHDRATPGVLELKSEGGFRKRDGIFITPEMWKADPPEWHQVQVQVQMACAGMHWGSLAGMFPGYDLRYVDIAEDAEFMALVYPVIDEFWGRVQRKDPPPVSDQPRGALDIVKRIWARESGSTIGLGMEHLELVDQWEAAKAARKDAEKQAEEIEAKLREAMTDATFGTLPDGTMLSLKTTKAKGYTKVVEPYEYRTLRRVKGK